MKKSIFLASLMMAFVICSCEKHGPDTPVEEDDFITLPLSVKGEILSFSDMPMTKDGASDDLYIIQAYASTSPTGDYVPFAYGFFNSLQNVSITVSKKNYYAFDVYCYKGGMKNLIKRNLIKWTKENTQTRVGTISNTNLSNTFTYSSEEVLDYRFDTDVNDDKGVCIFDVDLFYTHSVDFQPSQNSSIVFDMIRLSYGYKLVVDNLSEGSIKVSIGEREKITLTPSTPSFETTVMYQYNNTIIKNRGIRITKIINDIISAHSSGNDYSAEYSLKVLYVDQNDAETVIFADKVPFTRNKKKLISIHLSPDSEEEVSSVMKLNFESDKMEDDTPIYINH